VSPRRLRSHPDRLAGSSSQQREQRYPLSRRRFLEAAGGAAFGAALIGSPALARAARQANIASGQQWKDQVIMTLEVAKFATDEGDGNLTGDNSLGSNDIDRFEFALDESVGQSRYQGAGFLGGDLIGVYNNVVHLKDLGVTSVILYPVMLTDKQDFLGFLPTGYDITDWMTLDPNFRGDGQSATDYSSYINAINALRDPSIGGYAINVLQDLAISLTGHEHPWFFPLQAEANISKFRLWDPITESNNVGTPVTVGDFLFFDLSSLFNIDAFSYPSDTTDGDFDGQGNTYPADQVGYSVYAAIGYSNYLGYLLGLKLDGYQNAVGGSTATNVVIGVSQLKYCTLSVAAAAYGAPQNVTFRVSYSDGSHTDTPVTVPVWNPSATPANYLVQFPYMNTPSGQGSSPVYIYDITLSNDPTKSATSISLLASSGVSQVRIFGATGLPVTWPIRIDLSSEYNEDGISSDANKGDGNLSGSGLLFPLEGASSGTAFTPSVVGTFSSEQVTSTRFAVGPVFDGRDNMVEASGQTISVPAQQCHQFRVAAFATPDSSGSGPGPLTFSVNYSDGSSTQTQLTVKLFTATPGSSDVAVHQSDHAHRDEAGVWVDDTTTILTVFGYVLQADWSKQATSITLPSSSQVHVVAIDPVIYVDSDFALPVLDHRDGMSDNTGMYAYLEEVMSFWLGKVPFDGYRVDSVQNFFPSVLSQLMQQFWTQQYPGLWIFGEAAVAEPTLEQPSAQPLPWQLNRQDYTNPSGSVGLTGVSDFNAADAIRNTFGLQNSAASGQFSLIQQSITWDQLFEQPWNQAAFFDVYENDPFLEYATGDAATVLAKARLAAAYLLSLNRVPLLFTGDEYFVIYGSQAAAGSDARKPGYLFSSAVQSNSVYQDNYAYMKTLIAMRNYSSALRSAEALDAGKWVLQGDSLFGFVRSDGSSQVVLALFNNQSAAALPFTVNLPAGLTGGGTYNFIYSAGSGSYGGSDPAVSWNSQTAAQIAAMNPWEAKLILASGTPPPGGWAPRHRAAKKQGSK
jgi:glycosidase